MKAEIFLARLSERLGRPRPASAPPSPSSLGIPAVKPKVEILVERYAQEFARVGGRLLRLKDASEALGHLHSLRTSASNRELVAWGREEFASWDLEELWADPQVLAWDSSNPGAGAFRAAAARAGFGLTTVDRAVAETGSLVLTSGPNRPRSVSLLPTHHLALVRSRQLVSSLDQALAGADGAPARPPSGILCITGPSRTSDIENDLTIGVHGPAAVTVLLLEEG